MIIFLKKHSIFVFIFLLLIAVRFVWIDKIPAGMQIDEVEYALSSKTFQLMGTDISGKPFPSSIFTTNTIGRVSPVPYILLSPLWFVFNLTLSSYRFLYVILNCLTAGAFILLTHTLFKNKYIAFIGGIIFLLNPWSIFFSRHAIDGAFALLFYILGITFFLKPYTRRNIIYATIFFLLGAFSYHGAKLQLIPLASILTIFVFYGEKVQGKKIVPYLSIVGVLIIAIFMFFIGGILFKNSVLESRSQELVFTNMNVFAKDINTLREASITTPLQKIMINKIGFTFQYMLDNYFKSFDFTLLFLKAEIMNIHGFFYYFEIVFLIWGIISLLQKNKKIGILLIAITLIAPLSTVTSLSGFSILNRGILILPMLLLFISYGVYSAYFVFHHRVYKILYLVLVPMLYGGCFVYFLYLYFFVFPIQNYMHYETNTRILSRYLSLEQSVQNNVVVINTKPNTIFRGLLFYLPTNDQERIIREKQTFKDTTTYTKDTITFTDTCIDTFDKNTTYLIHKDSLSCYATLPANMYILNEKDAGIDYFIINGKTCTTYKLSRWHAHHVFSDFDIDTMNTETFCSRWIAGDIK